jgi:hypothetical protein
MWYTYVSGQGVEVPGRQTFTTDYLSSKSKDKKLWNCLRIDTIDTNCLRIDTIDTNCLRIDTIDTKSLDSEPLYCTTTRVFQIFKRLDQVCWRSGWHISWKYWWKSNKHCGEWNISRKVSTSSVAQDISAFYRTPSFITIFTSASYLCLSWASSIRSMPPHPTSWRQSARYKILDHHSLNISTV